jgi:hypothetical protein
VIRLGEARHFHKRSNLRRGSPLPAAAHEFCFLENIDFSVRSDIAYDFASRSPLSGSALVCLGAVILSSETRGYMLENKSWPDGTVITMQMEWGAPSKTLQDGSQTWNEAASPAIDAWNAEMQDIQLAAVMALLESNDNWQQSLNPGEIIDTGLAPTDPREARDRRPPSAGELYDHYFGGE